MKREGVPRFGLVRFNVSGLTAPVSRATLRLYALNGSDLGREGLRVANNWDEYDVTWENAPMPSPRRMRSPSSGPIENQTTWLSLDVTSLVSGNGTFSFAIGRSRSRRASAREP